MARLTKEIKDLNKHYGSIIRTILQKQGIALTEISEYNLLKEFMRIAEVDKEKRERMRNTKLISITSQPQRAQSTIRAETGYMTKLLPKAKTRRMSVLSGAPRTTQASRHTSPDAIIQATEGINKKTGAKYANVSLYSTSNLHSSDDEQQPSKSRQQHDALNTETDFRATPDLPPHAQMVEFQYDRTRNQSTLNQREMASRTQTLEQSIFSEQTEVGFSKSEHPGSTMASARVGQAKSPVHMISTAGPSVTAPPQHNNSFTVNKFISQVQKQEQQKAWRAVNLEHLNIEMISKHQNSQFSNYYRGSQHTHMSSTSGNLTDRLNIVKNKPVPGQHPSRQGKEITKL